MNARDRIALGLARTLAPPLFRGVYSSLRFEINGKEHQRDTWGAGQPVVFVTWHGRILPLLYLYRGNRIVMLVSRHRDGEYLARVGRALGYDAIRGSSTHGAFPALREVVRKLRAGRSIAITPDGPQGPRERLKPGVLQAVRLSGAPLIPVMAGAHRAWWIEGWDSFMIPKPFATVRVEIGEPRYVSRDCSVRDLEDHARELELQLQELKARVDGAGQR
ncbi:MAG: lysophospholipid acyltransferase family protein [Gemmatimonadota bacterium]|nr:MAG: lysophospholipid acyltransferase family protein [Gemmatimonadota bacterium]